MTASTAVPRRVIDCYKLTGRALPAGDLVVIRFECGHLDTLADLPNGFPTTEAVTGATLGCATCAGPTDPASPGLLSDARVARCSTSNGSDPQGDRPMTATEIAADAPATVTYELPCGRLGKSTCARCESGGMHYIKDCDSVCSKTQRPHCEMRIVDADQFDSTNGNCYWSAKCRQCGKRWEVDSSG